MDVGVAGALAAAGLLAGALGSAGGITSLVSYPALLLAGVPPLPANIANLVAGVACWPGSALTSRSELAEVRTHLPTALLVAAVGGAVGAALLLVTPAGTFLRVVPFLVAAGSMLLVVQPRLSGRSGQPWSSERARSTAVVVSGRLPRSEAIRRCAWSTVEWFRPPK